MRETEREMALLLPGPISKQVRPKVVVLQGINSRSSCDDRQKFYEELEESQSSGQAPAAFTEDFFYYRLLLIAIASAVQLPGTDTSVSLPGGKAADVIGFSYSGSYKDCTSEKTYSETSYPVVSGSTKESARPASPSVVLSTYRKADTCQGVRAAALRLGRLLDRIAAQAPEAPIILVGHSMGGMVATYYLSQLASPVMGKRIRAVITVDSPLLDAGVRLPSECTDVKEGGPGDQAWEDITGQSDVVAAIRALSGSSWESKLYAINSTIAGARIPGTYSWDAPCGTQAAGAGLGLGTILGTVNPLLGLIAGVFTYFEEGHSCAFDDPEALVRIGGIVRGE